jgi:hypothetical protein
MDRSVYTNPKGWALYVGGVAGEGHSYLKSPMWWTGMILSKLHVRETT